jgi:hypothetical protein
MYRWIPREDLVTRLSSETGMTKEQVREQLAEERRFILQYPQYF